MTPTIWICSHIHGLRLAVQNLLPAVNVKDLTKDEVLQISENENSAEVGILVADNPVFAPLLYKKNLPFKVIQSTWAGVDSLLPHLDGDRQPEVPICRFANENFSQLMAEYVLGQVLCSERRFRKLDAYQSTSTWASRDPEVTNHRSLAQLRIGILGLGKMGTRLAKTFKFFGSEVWGYARQASNAERPFIDQVCIGTSESNSDKNLFDLLQKCHYVVSTLPRTPHTTDLLSNGVLKHSQGSVLINVGRSNVVQESNLLEALDNGWLREAILDVFDKEPLPADHPFWPHPKIFVTPHVSALSMPGDIAACVLENYNRFTKGQALANLVNWDQKY